jgi:hypothetical protein
VAFETAGYYNYISTVTGGACFYLDNSRPASISKITVETLLAWMGTEKAGTDASVEFPAYLTQYISIDGIDKSKNERGPVKISFIYS